MKHINLSIIPNAVPHPCLCIFLLYNTCKLYHNTQILKRDHFYMELRLSLLRKNLYLMQTCFNINYHLLCLKLMFVSFCFPVQDTHGQHHLCSSVCTAHSLTTFLTWLMLITTLIFLHSSQSPHFPGSSAPFQNSANLLLKEAGKEGRQPWNAETAQCHLIITVCLNKPGGETRHKLHIATVNFCVCYTLSIYPPAFTANEGFKKSHHSPGKDIPSLDHHGSVSAPNTLSSSSWKYIYTSQPLWEQIWKAAETLINPSMVRGGRDHKSSFHPSPARAGTSFTPPNCSKPNPTWSNAPINTSTRKSI